MRTTEDGTQTPIAAASAETREAVMEAVREAKGRGAIRLAVTIDVALVDVESYLVVPVWATGETAAGVAAEMLWDMHGLDVQAGAPPLVWSLYTTAARRLGFPGDVPVLSLDGLGGAPAGGPALA